MTECVSISVSGHARFLSHGALWAVCDVKRFGNCSHDKFKVLNYVQIMCDCDRF